MTRNFGPACFVCGEGARLLVSVVELRGGAVVDTATICARCLDDDATGLARALLALGLRPPGVSAQHGGGDE